MPEISRVHPTQLEAEPMDVENVTFVMASISKSWVRRVELNGPITDLKAAWGKLPNIRYGTVAAKRKDAGDTTTFELGESELAGQFVQLRQRKAWNSDPAVAAAKTADHNRFRNWIVGSGATLLATFGGTVAAGTVEMSTPWWVQVLTIATPLGAGIGAGMRYAKSNPVHQIEQAHGIIDAAVQDFESRSVMLSRNGTLGVDEAWMKQAMMGISNPAYKRSLSDLVSAGQLATGEAGRTLYNPGSFFIKMLEQDADPTGLWYAKLLDAVQDFTALQEQTSAARRSIAEYRSLEGHSGQQNKQAIHELQSKQMVLEQRTAAVVMDTLTFASERRWQQDAAEVMTEMATTAVDNPPMRTIQVMKNYLFSAGQQVDRGDHANIVLLQQA